MKITRISVYQARLPYVGGTYVWGRNQPLTVALSTVVTIETDAGLTGCGESCPIGSTYLAAYGEGIPAAVSLMAPALIGEDPRELHRVERLMDQALKGHPYAKSAIDAACWEILGKAVGLPVCVLLGGRLTDGAPMYRVVPQKGLEETAAELNAYRQAGYRQFQIKVGGDWVRDIDNILQAASLLQPGENAYADANTGWTVNEAVKVVHAVRDTGIMIEQPCMTYEECLHVRARTDLPMKLDECVTDMRAAQRIVTDRAAEVVCLKISNLGGLTKARRVRDYLMENGLSVVSEDTWGGEITTAAVSHFAASTPSELLYNTTDLHNYVVGTTGLPGPHTENGNLYASTEPGLGVELDYETLGEPVVVFGG
ncbi:mandelate racemase/muconate lactonizing enzyme family protein [Coralliovum pocilloporae]|uniref:mandelate racemase/muconate lactonizing enzyme family protein n=1 Tax=Coralliovum pocilloporae TaxID=3066369 RepID=UPI0033079879